MAERARYRNLLVEERQRLCKARQEMQHAHKLDAAAQRRIRLEATRMAAAAAIETSRHYSAVEGLRRASGARSTRPTRLPTSESGRPSVNESEAELRVHEMRRLEFYCQMRRNWDLKAEQERTVHEVRARSRQPPSPPPLPPPPPPLDYFRPPPVRLPFEEPPCFLY